MSIFDYKNNSSELDNMNAGISRSQYDQTPPSREVSGANFPNGQISFRWENSGTRHWLPSRSFLRTRLRISTPAGASLNVASGIAPAMNLCAGLFQAAEFRINDKTVARVSDFLPQISTLEERLGKSESWLKGIGKSSNFWESSFKLRQVDLCSDGRTLPKTVSISTPTTGLVGGTLEVKSADGEGKFSIAQTANPPIVGDEFEIAGYKLRVIAVTNATTVTLYPFPVANIAATANYSRIRTDYVSEDLSRNVNTFELIWQPPLSVYRLATALPPGCRYECILIPNSTQSYVKGAIESVGADKVAGIAGDYIVNVIDMYHETFQVEGMRVDNATIFLDLNETNCSSEAVGVSNSYLQKNFTVSPSTQALTVVYQDTRCLSDSRFSPTRFKAYNPAGDTSLELKIDRYEIQYAGQQQPQPSAQLAYANGVDLLTERYVSSMLASGKWFDVGGAESWETFAERGVYFHHVFSRDGGDRSQQCTVSASFTQIPNGADLANTRLLLFSHSKKVCRLQIENGRLVDLQMVDA